jgi:hypothetical protein
MTATVVNHLREIYSNDDKVGVALVYCSYSRREEQTKEKLLASLLRQLVKHKHSSSEIVQTLYEDCSRTGRRPLFGELSKVLQYVASTYSKAMLVVDALDECECTELSRLISELRRLQNVLNGLRLMVTFRPHVDVAKELPDAATLEIRADTWDLGHYLNGQMSLLSKHVGTTSGLRDMIIYRIIEAAGGMFVLFSLTFLRHI